MKKFQFQFATVLKLRKSREEEALRILGAAQRAYQNELSRKAQLQADLRASLERREQIATDAATNTTPFQLENSFIVGTKQRITRQEQVIFRASKSVEKALRNYLQARKQTRMMESLRDSAYAEYRKARAKHEQKAQDDLTIMRTRLKEEQFG